MSPDPPLGECEVIITRAQHQQDALCHPLVELGAHVISAPVIKLSSPPPPHDQCYREGSWMLPIGEAGDQLERFDWLIFTSANSVRLTHEHWRDLGGLNGLYQGLSHSLTILCVGSSTQRALSQVGVPSSVIPKSFHAEGLIELLNTYQLSGASILIPRALIAREVLPQSLRAQRAEVWISPVYQTLTLPLSPQVKSQLQDSSKRRLRYLTFTSDSTLHSFTEQWTPSELQILQQRVRVVVIGPIVAQSAFRLGFHVHRVAEPHTIEGLIDAITADYLTMTK
jgi:uroporphyrinogen III methyltransferase/synthase